VIPPLRFFPAFAPARPFIRAQRARAAIFARAAADIRRLPPSRVAASLKRLCSARRTRRRNFSRDRSREMFDVAAAAAFPSERSRVTRISENVQRLLRIVADSFQNTFESFGFGHKLSSSCRGRYDVFLRRRRREIIRYWKV
jgi:hypothetical protein